MNKWRRINYCLKDILNDIDNFLILTSLSWKCHEMVTQIQNKKLIEVGITHMTYSIYSNYYDSTNMKE